MLSESVTLTVLHCNNERVLTCDRSHERFKLLIILAQVHHQQSAKGNVKCGSTAHVFVSSSSVSSKEGKVLTLENEQKNICMRYSKRFFTIKLLKIYSV